MDVKLREALKCEVIVRSASASGRNRRDAVPASESTHLRSHVSYNNHTPELEPLSLHIFFKVLEASSGKSYGLMSL